MLSSCASAPIAFQPAPPALQHPTPSPARSLTSLRPLGTIASATNEPSALIGRRRVLLGEGDGDALAWAGRPSRARSLSSSGRQDRATQQSQLRSYVGYGRGASARA